MEPEKVTVEYGLIDSPEVKTSRGIILRVSKLVPNLNYELIFLFEREIESHPFYNGLMSYLKVAGNFFEKGMLPPKEGQEDEVKNRTKVL